MSERNNNIIAKELNIPVHKVTATVNLLDDANTIPFIARYRKEVTGELNEEQIRQIEERIGYLRNLDKRREEILSSISAQEKLTDELAAAINACNKLQELEDLYLPYRPKKRTRAMIAREKGLQGLADVIMAQELDIEALTELTQTTYLNAEHEVNDVQTAWQLSADIIAEQISETAALRDLVRRELRRSAQLEAELCSDSELANDFINYQDFSKQIKLLVPHQILALNRGEAKGALKLRFISPQEHILKLLSDKLITNNQFALHQLLVDTISDSYKRLILPALERELRNEMTERAERQAISVFVRNLRQLLLQAPLKATAIMGLDPGYRTGCKLAVIDNSGKVLATSTIYITHSKDQREKAAALVVQLLQQHNVSLISIGNGTASYETEEFVAEIIGAHQLSVHYLITNEAGASVYSASPLAKEELPDLDVSLRGAVSIARRVQDPLAELVKIQPKAIGVGQYQHDVNQKELANSLATVVESCVNHVGVELNTASSQLLTYVAGISAGVAKNIITWRNEQGPFTSRKQLLKVPRLGPAAFTQAAGFLRIKESKHPLDNTPIHPESYKLAEQVIAELGFTDKEILSNPLAAAATTADAKAIAATLSAGEPTVRDILEALAKPGRDPRSDMPAPLMRKNISKLSDIKVGTIVRGTVHNVVDFGVFVDIGIKTNGLIHRSELSYKQFRHPLDVVSVGDIIDCMVIAVDEKRNRIALSLKQAQEQAVSQ